MSVHVLHGHDDKIKILLSSLDAQQFIAEVVHFALLFIMKLEFDVMFGFFSLRIFSKVLLSMVILWVFSVHAEPQNDTSAKIDSQNSASQDTSYEIGPVTVKYNFSNDPNTRKYKCEVSSSKRIAVIESGRYRSTPEYLKVIIEKLADDKYIDIPSEGNDGLYEDVQFLRDFLGNKVKGKCISFPRDSIFFLGFNDTLLKNAVEKLVKQADEQKIDLIISIGDLATKKLAEFGSSIPVLGINVVSADWFYEDKVTSQDEGKIFPAEERKHKYKNIYVINDSHSFSEFVDVFSKFFSSKKIGILKNSNPLMNNIFDYEALTKIMKNKSVEVVECVGDFFNDDEKISRKEFSKCMSYFSTILNLDAVYIGEMGHAVNVERFYSEIKPLLANQIPIFAFDYKDLIEAGAIFGIYDNGMNNIGLYTADIIEKIVDGYDMGSLQFLISTPMYAGLNLKSSGIIRWKPPFDILVSVDDVFSTIESK